MQALPVVVAHELPEHRPHVLLAHGDEVVQALVPKRPHHPFGDGVRPRRADRHSHPLDPEAPGPLAEVRAVDAITVTDGAEIHPEVAPLPAEIVLNKTGVDPFVTTGLDRVLRNARAEALLLMGLWTNWVVEGTARHASDLGYRVLAVRDCCASNTAENHAFALANIPPTFANICGMGEVLQSLGSRRPETVRPRSRGGPRNATSTVTTRLASAPGIDELLVG